MVKVKCGDASEALKHDPWHTISTSDMSTIIIYHCIPAARQLSYWRCCILTKAIPLYIILWEYTHDSPWSISMSTSQIKKAQRLWIASSESLSTLEASVSWATVPSAEGQDTIPTTFLLRGFHITLLRAGAMRHKMNSKSNENKSKGMKHCLLDLWCDVDIVLSTPINTVSLSFYLLWNGDNKYQRR